ncbi:DUF3290 domain-containing protein [Lentilactobacillus parafarraginis]|uniref:DUF3290 domain-containing protein n=1 Tax=Lentilactobacillus parafarraginis DSM 18390 = JCM 14109 TaxID=1423786 RepID=A0A0R1YAS5_9LACO|nr:DUF3290 domain-containing protein [Lentilactobacillus parafarraginis]KRM39466.1 hypothetical protein FD47_GL000191 [Lentilactobacillus parafarraginis DSM 18390 = JCM 14109]
MTFYTYNYLHASQSTWQYWRIALTSVLVIVFILFLLHYLRNRFDIKYKDLTIIVGTLLLLILGMQYNDFNTIQSSIKQSGQITTLLDKIAAELDVSKTTVSVNSTTPNDNVLVKTPKGYFRVNYNTDGSQFVLETVQLRDTNRVKIEGEK